MSSQQPPMDDRLRKLLLDGGPTVIAEQTYETLQQAEISLVQILDELPRDQRIQVDLAIGSMWIAAQMLKLISVWEMNQWSNKR